jgi:hypothetical protein
VGEAEKRETLQQGLWAWRDNTTTNAFFSPLKHLGFCCRWILGLPSEVRLLMCADDLNFYVLVGRD